MSAKVDLTLLKRFVSELEKTLATADDIKAEKTDKDQWVIEMSKVMGLIAGVVTESTMLMGDVQASVTQTGLPPISKDDILSRILGGKGPSNAN